VKHTPHPLSGKSCPSSITPTRLAVGLEAKNLLLNCSDAPLRDNSPAILVPPCRSIGCGFGYSIFCSLPYRKWKGKVFCALSNRLFYVADLGRKDIVAAWRRRDYDTMLHGLAGSLTIQGFAFHRDSDVVS
jgi:hypothetical protein